MCRLIRLVLLWASIACLGAWSANASAAVTWQAAGTAVNGITTTGIGANPPWPAHAINDIALLFVESTGGQPVTLSVPNGFVAVPNSPQATGTGTAGTQLSVFWARATSTAMPRPIIASPSDHFYAQIITFRGVASSGNPIDATAGGVKAAASTSVTLSGVTTTVANALIVQAVARDNDSAAAAFSAQANAALTGITERLDAGTANGNGGGLGVWSGVKAAAGATGNTTATVTNSINAFLTIALKPQPGASYQAAGAAVQGTGAVSPLWPVHAIDDLALLFVESTGGEAATLSTPAGFAAVANSPQFTGAGLLGTRLTVFWARATSAAMTAPTVADPGNHVYARILTYRKVVSAGNPWDVTGGGVKTPASTSVTVTGVTTTVADTLVVQAVARDNDSTAAAFSAQTNVNLSGITERQDAGTTQGNGGGFAVWDGNKATAGATGDTAATVTNSINAFLTIALRPNAPSAPVFQALGGAVATGLNWPAHAVDDVGLLFIETTGGQIPTLADAQGFVEVATSPQATGAGTAGTRLTVFWARATSAAMLGPTITGPTDHAYAQIITYRGATNSGNPWDVTGGGVKGGTSNAVTVTGVTTTVANTLIVQAVARDNDSTAAAFSAQTNANLTGIAERSDAGTTTGNGGGFAVWDGAKATAGATGNTTANVTNSINAFLTIALKIEPQALAEYRMDEGSWNGTAGEVLDASGNGNHAQAFNSASTAGTTPAIAGNPGTCRYGVFDNGGAINQGYVLTPLPDFTTDFTVAAWIRTTDNSIGGQRILVDDQNNTGGYGFSLGDGAAGRLRVYARTIAPVILDSTYTVASNTWYFVAAVIDIGNRIRTIHVFDAAGTLLNSTSDAAPFTGIWGTDAGPVSIGGETNASGESPATYHFRGNLDEVRVYGQALSQAALAGIAQRTHACTVVAPVPDHYELSMSTNSVACLPTTVTVTACTDASSPCTNPFAAANGTTAILGTSGGTLGVTPVTFGATGVASTTLSYPAAPDGTPVTVTLSGEQTAASNPRRWCPNGAGCVVANSGTTTFKTAGFIFSASAGGVVATIPTQVAGITSAAHYLRAVKTSTTTQACEAALAGANTVNFAYECNNPATCSASNLMSVNAGVATTIARNNNGSVVSYLPVGMTFDANGNAPLTFNYSDVGQVKLWATKAAGGSLLTALSGSSNSFVVKPHHFDIANIACTTIGAGTCAPANVTGNNPAASNAAGAAFIQAGQQFKATVTAMNGAATPAFTPNFGKETTAEGAELKSFNHLPGLGSAAAISRVLGGFNAGAATLTDLAWNEVGVLQLQATLSNANGYLGSDAINGKNSVVSAVNPYVGRFIPDHFDTVVTPQGGGFAYSGNPVGPVPGQPFTVTVTAKNGLASPTANYYYFNPGDFAKNANLTVPIPVIPAGQLYVDAVAGGAGAVPAAKFLNLNPGEGKVNYSDATGRISFVFNALPFYLALPIQIHAEDADTVTLSGANGSINIRHGRLRVFNAFGSDKADLSLPLRAEYWTGNSWVLNSADSFTSIPAGSIALSVVPLSGTLSAVIPRPGPFTLAGGQGSVVLASPMASGSVDLAINLGAGAADQSCLTTHPATTGAAIPWLRSINGSCAITYDRDPSARGSFGIYAPETRRTIHMRELF